jgi:hypothetical protein
VNATELASDQSPFGLIAPWAAQGFFIVIRRGLVKREGDDVLLFARDASLDKSRQKHGPVFVLGVNVRQDRARDHGTSGC